MWIALSPNHIRERVNQAIDPPSNPRGKLTERSDRIDRLRNVVHLQNDPPGADLIGNTGVPETASVYE